LTFRSCTSQEALQLRRQGERRERGLSLELYGSTYPATASTTTAAPTAAVTTTVTFRSVEVQAEEQDEGIRFCDAGTEMPSADRAEAGTGTEIEAEGVETEGGEQPRATEKGVPVEPLIEVFLILRDLLAVDKDVEQFLGGA